MFKRIITYSILTFVTLFGFFGNINLDIVQNNGDIHGVSLSYEENITYAACDKDGKGPLPCANPTTPDTGKKPESTDATKALNSVVETLNILLGFVTLAVSPAILFAGWLMSPDWTSGDLFGIRAPMYSLWVTVSNIVYFIYAILLILIALGTMFGKDTFSYKTMLPKLALGIIMVPFTWWFVQWTISLATVVTASVMTIPLETISKGENSTWMSTPSIPTKITISEGTGSGKTDIPECDGKKENGNCIAPINFLEKQSGMYGQMMVYAYSIFQLDKVKKLSFDVDGISTAVGVIHQGLIGAFMFIVFGLLTLALITMLLVRAIKLWVYAIFSPLFTFRFVAGSNILGGDDDTFSIKEFIGLCFVPAIVGLTLSFGLIMVNSVSSGTISNNTECTTGDLQSKGCKIAKLMGSEDNKIMRSLTGSTNSGWTTVNTFVWGAVTIDFIGKAGASKDPNINPEKTSENINKITSVINSAGGVFGTIIVDIIALMFIWLAFMAAKNISKALKAAAQPFEDIGNKVGGLAKSLPKYAPLPIPGGSISGLKHTTELASNKFETIMKEKELDNIGKFAPGLVEGVIKPKDIEALRNTISHNKSLGDSGAENIAKAVAKTQGNAKFTGGNGETVNQEIKGNLDDNQIKHLLRVGRFTNDEVDIMTKFYKGEAQAHDKAEKAWKLNHDKFGNGTPKDGTSGTTRPDVSGNGAISLGGININYNGANLNKHDELAEKIITGVKSEAHTMTKPTLDEIKKELKNMGLESGKIDAVATKIEGGIKNSTFKTNS